MTWNPEQYHRFQAERFLPFDDLIKLVHLRDGLRAIDLGCGTGELTRRLAELLPNSQVLGIDSSPEMLHRAAEHARPGLAFEQRPIEALEGQWDLIFSHAAIQWLPDHEALIPKLLSHLKPGGQLAVQVPSNHEHPTQRAIVETAREEPFRAALNGWMLTFPVLSIARYAEILHANGAGDLTVMAKVYAHILKDSDALVDWMRGTALIPYFQRMPESLKEPFLERYRAKLRATWPGSPVFFGFHRTLFAARRCENENAR